MWRSHKLKIAVSVLSPEGVLRPVVTGALRGGERIYAQNFIFEIKYCQ